MNNGIGTVVRKSDREAVRKISEMQDKIMGKLPTVLHGVPLKWVTRMHNDNFPVGETWYMTSAHEWITDRDTYEALLEYSPEVHPECLTVNISDTQATDREKFFVTVRINVEHPPEYLQALEDCGSLVEVDEHVPGLHRKYATIQCAVS